MKTEIETKINFAPIKTADKALYDSFYRSEECIIGESERGCEFSFANLYLWGRQNMAVIDNQVVLFSQFSRRSVYPYPVGSGDKKQALDAIIADAKERGIPCRITGLTPAARKTLEELYPDKFRFHSDEDSFDYVYDINDLAELPGKKYHAKRNHINRFKESFPNYAICPIDGRTAPRVKEMLDGWYASRLSENPDADFHMEAKAIEKALRDYGELELEGLAIFDGERVLAFTIGCRMTADTVDVNFEKAISDVQGAYTVVNYEFARYIRDKYPSVKYLDREEDMGIEGLRKAKRSYHPSRMIKKYWACLLDEKYEY